jgi:glycosyltransferase involved in cell wall biosynthesis
MRIVLLHNQIEDTSLSMKRYAQELSAALRTIAAGTHQIEDVLISQPKFGIKFLPPEFAQRWNSRVGRFIKYPLALSRTPGDVFHVLDHGYAQLLLALDGRKTVVTCHDLTPLLAAKGLVPLAVPGHLRYTFRLKLAYLTRAAFVIAGSESTRRDLLKHIDLPPQQLGVTYYGVSKTFAPATDSQSALGLRRKLGLSVKAKLVLQVANPQRYKNTPALLKALHELKYKSGLEVRLVRVGAPFFEDEESLIGKLGLKNLIVRAGQVAGDEALAEYYRAADVLAFPSLWEGFGLPPLEAMACGTPVVTSNVASLPEVVGEAGLMVTPQDYEELAQALYRVLTDESLHQTLRRRGLERAASFTWEQVARRTLAIYEEIYARSNRNQVCKK